MKKSSDSPGGTHTTEPRQRPQSDRGRADRERAAAGTQPGHVEFGQHPWDLREASPSG